MPDYTSITDVRKKLDVVAEFIRASNAEVELSQWITWTRQFVDGKYDETTRTTGSTVTRVLPA